MYDSKHRATDAQIYDTRKDGSGYSVSEKSNLFFFCQKSLMLFLVNQTRVEFTDTWIQ